MIQIHSKHVRQKIRASQINFIGKWVLSEKFIVWRDRRVSRDLRYSRENQRVGKQGESAHCLEALESLEIPEIVSQRPLFQRTSDRRKLSCLPISGLLRGP